MPAVRHPCLQCKEKHVKCDEERPKCQRCKVKKLSCSRPDKKTIFRHDAIASFNKDQRWVSSKARNFTFESHNGSAPIDSSSFESEEDAESPRGEGNVELSRVDSPSAHAPSRRPNSAPNVRTHPPLLEQWHSTDSAGAYGVPSMTESVSGFHTPTPSLPPIGHPPSHETAYHSQSAHHEPPSLQHDGSFPLQGLPSLPRTFPLDNIQEACLLRYFVEEMSHWLDLCDEQRHFQLVVPLRARRHPHLLDAIFAVAARHLSRMPQYKTSRGIVYHGQLLPDLNPHTAVEYMLKCIPALRHFRDGSDEEYQDSIIATAVILRQLEEIDDEEDLLGQQTGGDGYSAQRQVNFLAIIDAALRSPSSQRLFGQRSMIQAAYWMALRQEIYHSFTRRQQPQLFLAPEYWQEASRANKTVMHTVQVAKWHWGHSSDQEWTRLMGQQDHLEQIVLRDFQPILKRSADKSKGEIFPTLWYGSNIEVSSIQQAIIAKTVLVAENPFLRDQPRASWRKVENEVRLLILDLCGIALCHLACPPALVNAAIGIQLYGDFFTDQYERQALRGVVESYRDTHAWPVQRLLDMFR